MKLTPERFMRGNFQFDGACFKRILEQEMSGLIQSIDQLIEMHGSYGDTMQKDYLYKARRALIDGKDWFDWERRQPKKPAASQSDAGAKS